MIILYNLCDHGNQQQSCKTMTNRGGVGLSPAKSTALTPAEDEGEMCARGYGYTPVITHAQAEASRVSPTQKMSRVKTDDVGKKHAAEIPWGKKKRKTPRVVFKIKTWTIKNGCGFTPENVPMYIFPFKMQCSMSGVKINTSNRVEQRSSYYSASDSRQPVKNQIIQTKTAISLSCRLALFFTG